jgi:hypothetical protein
MKCRRLLTSLLVISDNFFHENMRERDHLIIGCACNTVMTWSRAVPDRVGRALARSDRAARQKGVRNCCTDRVRHKFVA